MVVIMAETMRWIAMKNNKAECWKIIYLLKKLKIIILHYSNKSSWKKRLNCHENDARMQENQNEPKIGFIFLFLI